MTDLAVPYQPDWVSPPGDTLLDIIEERDWTQSELAQRLGYTTKHVNQLIKGKVPLTEDAAIRLVVSHVERKRWNQTYEVLKTS